MDPIGAGQTRSGRSGPCGPNGANCECKWTDRPCPLHPPGVAEAAPTPEPDDLDRAVKVVTDLFGDTVEVGVCGRCQQTGTALVGTDSRGSDSLH